MTCTFCKRKRKSKDLRPLDSTGRLRMCRDEEACERETSKAARETAAEVSDD